MNNGNVPIKDPNESISKYKKKIALTILAYLAIGYVVNLWLYLLSSPGYLMQCSPNLAPYKCVGVMGLVRNLSIRSDFWFDVTIWPLKLIFYLIGSN